MSIFTSPYPANFLIACLCAGGLHFSSTALVAAEPFAGELVITFDDQSQRPFACQKNENTPGNLQEILRCYWDSGFPYAHLCDTTEFVSPLDICAGPRVRISEFHFAETLGIEDRLIEEIGDFRHGQLYNQTQVVDFVNVLKSRFGAENVEVMFEQVGLGSVGMIVSGDMPQSSFAGGLHFDNEYGLFANFEGRHYVGGYVPDFIEYGFSGSISQVREFEISMPIFVSRLSTERLGFSLYDLDANYYDVRGFSLSFQSDLYGAVGHKLPRVENFFVEVTDELFSSSGGTSWRDTYLQISTAARLVEVGFFDKAQMRLSAFGLVGGGLTSRFDLLGSAVRYPFGDSDILIRYSSSANVMFGSVSRSPINERIFLGGEEMRGYFSKEIGWWRDGAVTASGGQWSVSSKFDILFPFFDSFQDILLGIHLDAGVISPGNGEGYFHRSFGVLADFPIGDGSGVQVAFSRSGASRNFLSIGINSRY